MKTRDLLLTAIESFILSIMFAIGGMLVGIWLQEVLYKSDLVNKGLATYIIVNPKNGSTELRYIGTNGEFIVPFGPFKD